MGAQMGNLSREMMENIENNKMKILKLKSKSTINK